VRPAAALDLGDGAVEMIDPPLGAAEIVAEQQHRGGEVPGLEQDEAAGHA
jgi:hypothetical protein